MFTLTLNQNAIIEQELFLSFDEFVAENSDVKSRILLSYRSHLVLV